MLKPKDGFLDRKTNGGAIKGKIAFYCNALHVTRQDDVYNIEKNLCYVNKSDII